MPKRIEIALARFYIKNDYNSSPPPPCAELDYLDIQAPTGELRYNQESASSSLTIDAPESSPLLNLFHPNNVLNPSSNYGQDPNSFYSSSGSIFAPDGRLRLTSNNASSTGMGHVQLHSHRTATLPQLGSQVTTRDQFSASISPYRRISDQYSSRSPPFPGANTRRPQLNSTHPNPLTGYTPPTPRMDPNQGYANRASQNEVPPLMPIEMLGALQYIDPIMTNIKVDISGIIDKGPFLSPDHEWTCYRRNYLACICSFTLNPSYPGLGMQFTPAPAHGANTSQTFQVCGFAMCISAMVADNEQHGIELVQHTPKRDKGPVSKPTKTVLAPKSNPPPHSSLNMYSDGSALASTRNLYSDGYGGQQGPAHQVPTEHTFERIQFKQATQNNGKRRAAQQYYHLVVELWADVGTQSVDKWVKVAFRKSAKMIVRGRSPGHYQNERRNSQGNGTGGSSGSSGYRQMGPMGDFGNNVGMAGASLAAYNPVYDARGANYNVVRHHEVSPESIFSPSDDKNSIHTKAYQYYSGSSYDPHNDRVDMFGNRNGTENLQPPISTDGRKVKPEFDFNMLPSPFPTGARADDHHRERFDGRPSSGGFYPAIVSPTGIGTL